MKKTRSEKSRDTVPLKITTEQVNVFIETCSIFFLFSYQHGRRYSKTVGQHIESTSIDFNKTSRDAWPFNCLQIKTV